MLFEKHRPTVFKELVGREKEIKQVEGMLKNGDLGHLFLYGPPGTGKTTFAGVIANEVLKDSKDSNYYEFNASKDRGIDFIRNTVSDIAKRRPFGVPYKIILMDEADHITPDAQACFRRILEEHHHSTRFIFTANYPYKMIPALHSRFVSIEFPVIDQRTIAKRLKKIAKIEGMEIDDKRLIALGKQCNGDLRKAINMLQGGTEECEISNLFEEITIEKLSSMTKEERILLAFKGDPEMIFAKIWEMVQKEGAWDKVDLLSQCNYKMNMSVHKTLFLAHLLQKFE